ncbi:phosphonate C-P lyase system protein PhnH [Thalassospiraceae bacterium LMO-SO8]|nr:phosphonate C-P lyase system protein PhnH [Alphaproteobacteria bacterium LMO-S08]WND74745.1 phosphonate C-P lyase system protein PhnH [Thalassospiraceae bacterium LMO-SO8]
MTAPANMAAGGLAAGLPDPVHDAQGVFRDVLRAMSRPGEVRETAVQIDPPFPLTPAAAAVCLALLDFETPLWIDGGGRDTDAAAAFLAFHTGAPRAAGPDQADFVLIADGLTLPALDGFRQGTDEAPENSATLIVQVADLAAGLPGGEGVWRLTGPGIDGDAGLRIAGLPEGIVEQLGRNADRFPRGVDLILCGGRRIAALPRTTRVEG